MVNQLTILLHVLYTNTYITDSTVVSCLHVALTVVTHVDKPVLALVMKFIQHRHRWKFGSSQRWKLIMTFTCHRQKRITPVHQVTINEWIRILNWLYKYNVDTHIPILYITIPHMHCIFWIYRLLNFLTSHMVWDSVSEAGETNEKQSYSPQFQTTVWPTRIKVLMEPTVSILRVSR